MLTLRYSLPPDKHSDNERTETTVTTVELSETTPAVIASEIEQLYDDAQYDITVTLKLKQSKN